MNQAKHILSALRKKGWILRVQRGRFAVIPLSSGSSRTAQIHEFLIAMELVQPAAIAYLSALNHHGMTEQLPRTVVGGSDGFDQSAFAAALRSALREDPDVILVGEMRDLETIEAAITAAETGHVVFGTLHTTGAQGTVNRIIDVFPTNQQEQIRTQLSTSIIGIVSQALLPKIGGGRIAAYEMLVVNSAVANLIRENKTFRITSVIQTGQKLGMQLLDDNMFRLWKEGIVDKREILLRSNNVDEMAAKIARVERGMFEDEDEAQRRLDTEEGELERVPSLQK